MNKANIEKLGYETIKEGGYDLFFVKEQGKKAKYWAIFTDEGEQLTPFIYNEIIPYKYNYAIALIDAKHIENKCYINNSSIDHGLAPDVAKMYTNERDKTAVCLLNKKGEVVLNSYFKSVECCEGLKDAYMVSDPLPRHGIIKENGEFILPKYRLHTPFEGGYARAYNYSKIGVVDINKQGEVVVPLKYATNYIGKLNSNKTLLFIDKESKKFGYADMSGAEYLLNEVDGKIRYTDTNKNLAPIPQPGLLRKGIDNNVNYKFENGKLGFYDDEGTVFIEPSYENTASILWGGITFVKKDGKWAFIDKSENQITPFVYDHAGFIAPGYGQGLVDDTMHLIGPNGVIATIKGGYFGYKRKAVDPTTQNKRYSCGIDFIWYVSKDKWTLMDELDGRDIQYFTDGFTYMKYDETLDVHYFETGKNKGVDLNGNTITIEEKVKVKTESKIGRAVLENLQKAYGERAVPTLWCDLLLNEWVWNSSDVGDCSFSKGIILYDHEQSHFEGLLEALFDATEDNREELFSQFYFLGGADGTGAMYAYFIADDTKPLEENPIVFLGTEGEINLVAATLVEFLQLISIDTEPIGCSGMDKKEIICYYKDLDNDAPQYFEDYITWLKENEIKPITVRNQLDDQPKGAMKIIKNANKLYFKQLLKLYQSYTD